MTRVAEHAEHLPQLAGLVGRDPRLVVSPPPRREKTRPGAVALRQRAGGENADCNDGEDDDCGDLLGKVTEMKRSSIYIYTRNIDILNQEGPSRNESVYTKNWPPKDKMAVNSYFTQPTTHFIEA